MVIFKKANDNQIERLVEISKAADIVYVGRIFVDPLQYRKGYGKEIMQQIEKVDAEKHIFRLETPVWNQRTNSFYPKCGYEEMFRDEESVYYQKVLG